MDPIKEAFQKIKQDIDLLKEDIALIREGLLELSDRLDLLSITTPTPIPTDRQTNQQDNTPSVSPLYSLISQKTPSSIGNRGVPTDRQTNQQTDKPTVQTELKDPVSEFRRANEVLNSLDSLKKEIRSKFKALTLQEMAIFAQIWDLDSREQEATYKVLAEKTRLSESSIRDYTNKLIKKGIPLEKIKQNNKIILLKVSQDLKNLTNLDTILQLRNL